MKSNATTPSPRVFTFPFYASLDTYLRVIFDALLYRKTSILPSVPEGFPEGIPLVFHQKGVPDLSGCLTTIRTLGLDDPVLPLNCGRH